MLLIKLLLECEFQDSGTSYMQQFVLADRSLVDEDDIVFGLSPQPTLQNNDNDGEKWILHRFQNEGGVYPKIMEKTEPI